MSCSERVRHRRTNHVHIGFCVAASDDLQQSDSVRLVKFGIVHSRKKFRRNANVRSVGEGKRALIFVEHGHAACSRRRRKRVKCEEVARVAAEPPEAEQSERANDEHRTCRFGRGSDRSDIDHGQTVCDPIRRHKMRLNAKFMLFLFLSISNAFHTFLSC